MTKNKKRFSPAQSGFVALALSPLIFALGCSKPFQASEDLGNKAADTVGCTSFSSDFYDGLYQFAEQKTGFPSEADMQAQFSKSVQQGRLSKLSVADQQRVAIELTALYKLLAVDSLRKLGQENASDDSKLATLTALEIGDSSTPEKEELQAQIHAELSKIDTLLQSTDAPSCAKSPASPEITGSPVNAVPVANSLIASWKSTQPRAVYGALKTMATAYQSCDITKVAPFTLQTPDVVGVKDLGVGSDGIGHKRLVSSASDILRTNPYLANYRKPASSCFDLSKTPLIYDYGGRPSTSTGAFDMFKNNGGTAALGTDCSGYVYMALATAGLRVKKATALKAVTVSGITSTLFTNPQKNGLTCFDYVKFAGSDTLRAGDVVAKAGHVFLIKSVGKDPFGIADIQNASDCTLANVSVKKFNFTIIQDSSSKNGLGMHMHSAADYLQIPDSKLMADGLLGHAVGACKAKFGSSVVATNSHVSIVRHTGSSDCVQSTEIQLAHQACVETCQL